MEEASDIRHELHDGIAVGMAGGTADHNSVAINLIAGIKSRLERKCRVHSSDMRVRVGRSMNYYYPDVIVVCAKSQFDPPDRRITLTNPQVIFEITSKSTEAFDRGEKFFNYMSIQSLQEYILVDQERARIDTFYRQTDGVWAIGHSVEGLDGIITLRSLGIDLSANDIYADVEFPPPPAAPQTAAVDS